MPSAPDESLVYASALENLVCAVLNVCGFVFKHAVRPHLVAVGFGSNNTRLKSQIKNLNGLNHLIQDSINVISWIGLGYPPSVTSECAVASTNHTFTLLMNVGIHEDV